jgi:hypothetical protein
MELAPFKQVSIRHVSQHPTVIGVWEVESKWIWPARCEAYCRGNDYISFVVVVVVVFVVVFVFVVVVFPKHKHARAHTGKEVLIHFSLSCSTHVRRVLVCVGTLHTLGEGALQRRKAYW